MTIKGALNEAKSVFTWSIVPYEPTSVRVKYMSEKRTIQETIFNLYTDSLEKELVELWESLFAESGTERDAVKPVEAYGYIID